MQRPNFRLPPPVMVSIPVGGTLDIPTGSYVEGLHDQRVLVGGVSNITGFVGPGNSFKTTIMRYHELSALSRVILVAIDSYLNSFDTELNTREDRNERLARVFEFLKNIDLLKEGIWQITNRAVYSGNEWFADIKKYLNDKASEKNPKLFKTAFYNRDRTGPMMMPTPSFVDVDSLTHFMTSDVEKMLEGTELGDPSGNTIFMRQGLAKSKLLMELPELAARCFNYFLFTAHIGKEIVMPSAPGTPPPRKQLQHMPQGEIIKGVTNNFFYLLHNCWLLHTAKPFLNQGTKAPEYPFEPGDERAGDLDLNIVTMRQLRGKNGQTGFTLEMLVSQAEGVLATLTEFHYIKKADRFGLQGNDRNYQLVIYPDVSLSRTTVRAKCRQDKKLQRAMNITSETMQITEYQREHLDTLLPMEELYAKIAERGYDWDMILTQTRSWNTLEDDIYPLYPLSTLDLHRMARGEYHPYWLSDDCKTIKPEYEKLKMKF